MKVRQRHLAMLKKLRDLDNDLLLPSPTDGHLYVVERTSTPFRGKLGAINLLGYPPWGLMVPVACNTPTKKPYPVHIRHDSSGRAVAPYSFRATPGLLSTRLRATRREILSLLARAGIPPNPGPSLRVAQFNALGLTPETRVSLRQKAQTLKLDVILLQELHLTQDECDKLAMPGYVCYAQGRNAKGGGVAVLVSDALQSTLHNKGVRPNC